MRSKKLLTLALCAVATPLAAQGGSSQLTVDRIFDKREFSSAPLPTIHWLKDGASYLDVRPAEGGGSDIVRVDLTTGRVSVLAPASALVDESGKRIEVEEIALSSDESKALLFHRSVRVWRANTRGMYHVVRLRTRKVQPIARITKLADGAAAKADTTESQSLSKDPSFLAPSVESNLQMFAKFSPDGRHVAFVRDNNLFVTDLASGDEHRLTSDGSSDIINGTTDWVYEEELGLRDAFRWSPDSKRLAYWRFDQSAVPAFPMVDETSLYPSVAVLRYPKAGAPNSRVKVGVIAATGGETKWLDVGSDTGQYLARMDWISADSLIIQRMPRKQNQVDVLMVSATSGKGRTVLTERDSAYVDVEGEGAIAWIKGGRQFLWRSDRSGWRQIFLHDRDGRMIRQVTADGVDVLAIVAVDSARGDLYALAAAPTPTQRQLFRYSIESKRAPQRVTAAEGSHTVTIGPTVRWAVDFHSSVTSPTIATLYELPAMRLRRVITDNAALKAKLAALESRPVTFFQIPMPDGVKLDAYRIVPPGFDSTRKYPVLMYVYGGPASPTVTDAFGGTRQLWHQLLAQKGYIVVSADNRGSAWRGRDFRKTTQYNLGKHESADQIDVAKWLAKRSWVDGARIGIWGWSYGGYMSTLCAGKGGEIFKAAIAVAPVADWRLYDTIYTERFMWLPSENAAGYKDSAPLNFVDGIKANFLLVHGTGDDNVHAQHSIQLANQMQSAGVPFQLMLYPNRTHSIAGGNTQSHLYEMMTRFIVEKL
ncbi:MAG: S9 family peptidase [Gemmatimonadota bacterium]|nr:S9 family peptidase [Gemmatimonadota bacterium]